MLRSTRGKFERALIVVEGLYSMDGDYPTCRVSSTSRPSTTPGSWSTKPMRWVFWVQRGYGTAEHFGVDPRQVDIWMGTLSKTLAGCGGYIAGCTNSSSTSD